jgi:type II secretory pathway pseudopilin PulG
MKISFRRWIALAVKSTIHRHASGFTLLETIILVVVIGILFAIMAPSWDALMTTFRLSNAQNTALQAMREAQGNAKRNHLNWQASFRDLNGSVDWAIHPSSGSPLAAQWNSLGSQILVDAETSLQMTSGIYRVRFDDWGNVSGQLGRLTLASRTGGKTKRCVIVSTLIGAMRLGQNRATAQDGRFCW